VVPGKNWDAERRERSIAKMEAQSSATRGRQAEQAARRQPTGRAKPPSRRALQPVQVQEGQPPTSRRGGDPPSSPHPESSEMEDRSLTNLIQESETLGELGGDLGFDLDSARARDEGHDTGESPLHSGGLGLTSALQAEDFGQLMSHPGATGQERPRRPARPGTGLGGRRKTKPGGERKKIRPSGGGVLRSRPHRNDISTHSSRSSDDASSARSSGSQPVWKGAGSTKDDGVISLAESAALADGISLPPERTKSTPAHSPRNSSRSSGRGGGGGGGKAATAAIMPEIRELFRRMEDIEASNRTHEGLLAKIRGGERFMSHRTQNPVLSYVISEIVSCRRCTD
jgi:hypothetical protein